MYEIKYKLKKTPYTNTPSLGYLPRAMDPTWVKITVVLNRKPGFLS